ncbi:50S ribosomal protein L11 methyltransferase [Maricaulaceae bacterium MS644]
MSTIWRLRIDGPLAPLSAANARLGEHDDQPALGWSLFEAEDDASRGYIELLFADRVREDEWLAALDLEGEAFTVHFAPLPDEDWIALSLKGLPAIAAGRFMVYGEHEKDKLQPGQIGLWIEAGPAFGTGHHGTTKGCLEALDRLYEAGLAPKRILDLGTGSGLLAIAAAKLWPDADILATDIDPESVEETAVNAARNDTAFEAVIADGFDHPAFEGRSFDLVLANILAGPLIHLAPEIAAVLEPGGTVVLSGLLEEQADGVTRAYVAQGLSLQRSDLVDGWGVLVLAS